MNVTAEVVDKEKEGVLNYFKNKANDYDLVDTQYYWKLSDCILLDIFKTKVLDKLQKKDKKIQFLDAGGGTGRWTIQILKHYQNATGTIVDISEHMLEQARRKLISMGKLDKIDIHNEDLDKFFEESSHPSKYNLAFTFHNVIGFVQDPKGLIANLAEAILPGGYVVVLAPNLYHVLYFNITAGRIQFSQDALSTNKGKFTEDMPAMHMFTPATLRECFESAGMENIFISGFPSTIYPQYQETQIQGSTKSLSNLLIDENYFNGILEIEKQLLEFTDIAARGNQLIGIGRKPE